MITIKVNLGAFNFAERLAILASSARRQINLQLAEALRTITVSTFESRGATLRPKPWPPKKDGTVATLKREGTLSASFGIEATPDAAVVFTPVEYAAQHQFGGDFEVPEHDRTIRQAFGRPIDPPKTIRVRAYKMSVPARPFFPFDDLGNLTPSAERILVETAEAGIERELQRGSSG